MKEKRFYANICTSDFQTAGFLGQPLDSGPFAGRATRGEVASLGTRVARLEMLSILANARSVPGYLETDTSRSSSRRKLRCLPAVVGQRSNRLKRLGGSPWSAKREQTPKKSVHWKTNLATWIQMTMTPSEISLDCSCSELFEDNPSESEQLEDDINEDVYSECLSDHTYCEIELPSGRPGGTFLRGDSNIGALQEELIPHGCAVSLLASRSGDLDVLKRLKAQGQLDTNCRDRLGASCLHYAVRGGHVDVLRFLSEEVAGDDIPRSAVGATPLHDAAALGHLEALRYLIRKEKSSFDLRDFEGATILHVAARYGRLNVLRWLLSEADVPLDGKTNTGALALHYAAARGCLDCVQLLVEASPKFSANATMENGVTPVYLAAQEGHLPVLQFLVDRADGRLDLRTCDGMAPLHAASQMGCVDCVSWMVEEQGVDPNLPDGDGATALHFAASRGHLKTVKWLLQNGAQILLDRHGKSPINDAADSDYLEVLQILLDHSNSSSTLPDAVLGEEGKRCGCVCRQDASAGAGKGCNKSPRSSLDDPASSYSSTCNSDCSSDSGVHQEPFYLHPPELNNNEKNQKNLATDESCNGHANGRQDPGSFYLHRQESEQNIACHKRLKELFESCRQDMSLTLSNGNREQANDDTAHQNSSQDIKVMAEVHIKSSEMTNLQHKESRSSLVSRSPTYSDESHETSSLSSYHGQSEDHFNGPVNEVPEISQAPGVLQIPPPTEFGDGAENDKPNSGEELPTRAALFRAISEPPIKMAAFIPPPPPPMPKDFMPSSCEEISRMPCDDGTELKSSSDGTEEESKRTSRSASVSDSSQSHKEDLEDTCSVIPGKGLLYGKHISFIPPKFPLPASENDLIKPSEYLKLLGSSGLKSQQTYTPPLEEIVYAPQTSQSTEIPREEEQTKYRSAHSTVESKVSLPAISVSDLKSVQLKKTKSKISKTCSVPLSCASENTNNIEAKKSDIIAELKKGIDMNRIKKEISETKEEVEEELENKRENEEGTIFTASSFVEKVPEKDSQGNPIPDWKRQMLAKKAAERAKKEAEEERLKEEEKKRLESIPAWKRQLLARKEEEAKRNPLYVTKVEEIRKIKVSVKTSS